jgi:integrase
MRLTLQSYFNRTTFLTSNEDRKCEKLWTLPLRARVLTTSQLIDNTWKSYATKMGYENYLKRLRIRSTSCAKVAKRRRMPHILHVDEIKRLLNNVASLPRLLIFLDVTTGLRQSELFGLRWSDLDFDNGEINVVRSVVHGVVSRCKTETSAKPIPMGPFLAEMLKEWRKMTRFSSGDDWVFASKRAKGKRPIWGQSIMRKQIHPAIEKLGIKKRIGWQTFRHSYSTLLRQLGTDIKVQQDLLRHSSARLTLDTYTQAFTPAKREAQNAVVQLLLSAELRAAPAPTTNDSNVST